MYKGTVMKDIKLNLNFRLSEFVNLKEELTDYQIMLVKLLACELQELRGRLQEYKSGMKPVNIVITSGIRTKKDYDRLKKQGYNPSQTSDHFCGYQMVSGRPTIGAADIKVYNCSMSTKKIALFIKDLVERGVMRLGQVIYEKNPATGAEWIHLGNDPHLIFTDFISSTVERKKFLMSTDNGKTYRTLK